MNVALSNINQIIIKRLEKNIIQNFLGASKSKGLNIKPNLSKVTNTSGRRTLIVLHYIITHFTHCFLEKINIFYTWNVYTSTTGVNKYRFLIIIFQMSWDVKLLIKCLCFSIFYSFITQISPPMLAGYIYIRYLNSFAKTIKLLSDQNLSENFSTVFSLKLLKFDRIIICYGMWNNWLPKWKIISPY